MPHAWSLGEYKGHVKLCSASVAVGGNCGSLMLEVSVLFLLLLPISTYNYDYCLNSLKKVSFLKTQKCFVQCSSVQVMPLWSGCCYCMLWQWVMNLVTLGSPGANQ